ncbi:MAG: tripartite tricarboxylate transporter TctB family protein [Rhodospirillaceae bacterium]|jgi:putative tricarboxylic transport membrane protein|nr:tripartite tricarboxylate transporter TctB family protein [Rhodospirillaceae bacterium]
MRIAELVMALVMAVFSIYLMWKSAELPIGWLPGEGPGGGAFPFWLSLGMLICCGAIILRWIAKASPPSQSSEPFMTARTVKSFLLVAGSLTAMIGLTHIIGVYGAVPLFLIFYVRFLGRHSWTTTCALAFCTPVAAFFFFEIALKKTLPKGFTEPLFYPLYDIFL